MTKTQKIIYWVATVWLSFGLVSTGIVQLIPIKEEVEMLNELGYTPKLLPLLGISKLLAAVAILIPGFPRLKEWAYAGVIFTMIGAVYSHFMANEPQEIFPPVLFMLLVAVSWYFRPESRRVVISS